MVIATTIIYYVIFNQYNYIHFIEHSSSVAASFNIKSEAFETLWLCQNDSSVWGVGEKKFWFQNHKSGVMLASV